MCIYYAYQYIYIYILERDIFVKVVKVVKQCITKNIIT